jgi:hypothetical protein
MPLLKLLRNNVKFVVMDGFLVPPRTRLLYLQRYEIADAMKTTSREIISSTSNSNDPSETKFLTVTNGKRMTGSITYRRFKSDLVVVARYKNHLN